MTANLDVPTGTHNGMIRDENDKINAKLRNVEHRTGRHYLSVTLLEKRGN